MAKFHTVGNARDIPDGEARMYVVEQTMIGIFRIGDEYYAINNQCPHAGASLAHGIIEGDIVRCRIHHWRFCVKDGTYLDEAKPALNAQTYPVRLIADRLQVKV